MPAINARPTTAPELTASPLPEIKVVDAAFALPADHAAAASPALALQRQLGDAVLRDWYAPRLTAAPGFTGRQAATIVACAAASWVVVFGAGWALLG